MAEAAPTSHRKSGKTFDWWGFRQVPQRPTISRRPGSTPPPVLNQLIYLGRIAQLVQNSRAVCVSRVPPAASRSERAAVRAIPVWCDPERPFRWYDEHIRQRYFHKRDEAEEARAVEHALALRPRVRLPRAAPDRASAKRRRPALRAPLAAPLLAETPRVGPSFSPVTLAARGASRRPSAAS